MASNLTTNIQRFFGKKTPDELVSVANSDKGGGDLRDSMTL